MQRSQQPTQSSLFLPREALDTLIRLLRDDGYTVIAPRLMDDAVMLRPVESADDLPVGVSDAQDPGSYRLQQGDTPLAFDYVIGPDSAKRFLFPPIQPLVQLRVEGESFKVTSAEPPAPKLAFLGLRACDLAAMSIQDRVFNAEHDDAFRCESEPYYVNTRQNAFFIAVNCTRPAKTCFCSSMGTGPRATEGFDIAITEIRDGFVTTIGSDRGRELVDRLPVRDATGAESELEELKIDRARECMDRQMRTQGLKARIDESLDHAVWAKTAERCLSCGNCTMVCPTCFCSTVTDSTELDNSHITRTRYWESCFSEEFTYAVGGPERNTVRGRYRHWFRHKFSTWFDQFDTGGCVGCGRCITWCPVGIDVTEVAAELHDQTSVNREVNAC